MATCRWRLFAVWSLLFTLLAGCGEDGSTPDSTSAGSGGAAGAGGSSTGGSWPGGAGGAGESCGQNGCELALGESCSSCAADCGACPTEKFGAELFVAPPESGGSDQNPGTEASPMASLEAARDAIRALRKASGLPAGGVVVWLRAGAHRRTTTFELGPEDGGEKDKPVVYRARPSERALLTGGATLEPKAFSLVTASDPGWAALDPKAQGQVWVAHLPTHGVTDFGTLQVRTSGQSATSALELSFDGTMMTLARWPDDGQTSGAKYPGYVATGELLSSTAFELNDDRIARWAAAATAKTLWAHGYWAEWWADQHLPIASIDASTHRIELSMVPYMGLAEDHAFYVYNLLEELTAPGEYYLDRGTGRLYFWPPKPLSQGALVVSMLEAPLVRLNGTAFVRLEDLELTSGRGNLVRIDGGSDNVLRRCRLVSSGSDGVIISGTRNGVDRSEVAHTGDKAVVLTGGSRASLTRGENFVTQSNLHHFGRWGRTYQQGVHLSGCGHVVAHNQIHHAPHSAIEFVGNEHTIELNEIHEVCQFSSDAGAIYSGRNWGFRGNVIRHNFLHDIDSPFPGFGEHGVYMDDALAGVKVFGNVFYRISGYAIEHGGGRDAIMENNVMARCGAALLSDSRGIQKINAAPGDSWNFLEKLGHDGVAYQAEPWASKYPELAKVPSDWSVVGDDSLSWRYPEGSVFSRNVGFHNDAWTIEQTYGGSGTFNKFAAMEGNQEKVEPLFVNEDELDLTIAADSPALKIPGFQPIPFAQIGIQPPAP